MKLTRKELTAMIFKRFPDHWLELTACERMAEEILAKLDEPEPVIEVGDTVQGPICSHSKCKVKRQSGDFSLMLNDNFCSCKLHTDRLTLISKGPKVHTFEGVSLWRREECALVCDNSSHSVLKNFCNGDNINYTMTLTEETQ